MTAGLMRSLFSSSIRAQLRLRHTANGLAAPRSLGLKLHQRTLSDARPRQASISKTYFTSTSANPYPELGGSDNPPPDQRTVKLGNTIRILHDRLPTLLASPLPQDILSPHITLHLFPSTHPHLPTVTGKLGYTAALWTAPVAWGRVPVVGNVKLVIVSERMVKNTGRSTPAHMRDEKLIVKWKTCSKENRPTGQLSEAVEKISKIVTRSDRPDEEFSGLFKFQFDEEGRIIKHIIEHAEEHRDCEKTAKVLSVTDWLLGRAWGRREEGVPSLAFVECEHPKSSGRTSHKDQ